MSLSHSIPTRSHRAIAVVIALIASLLVLVSPNLDSKADYIDSNTGPIVYNDRVCNLGDPNDHTTSDTAFEISTSEQLWEITDCVSNSATIYFELGDDIDVSDASKAGTAPTASPIGFSTLVLAYSFSGFLDGKNRTISGLDMSADDYGVGLFAYLHNATISNLVIAGSIVTNTSATATSHAAGALAIRASGSLYLSSISNQASVTGKENVGGLVGYVELDANINSSYNTGNVSGSDNSVGGLVGKVNKNANITSSYNTGIISGTAFYVGGLVGEVKDNANINASYNIGPVSGATQIGGLVGYVEGESSIDSSYNAGSVSASSSTADGVGGLVGLAENGLDIRASYNTGPVSGKTQIGGLVGYVRAEANINSSYNTGPVSGSDTVGGLVGRVNEDAIISSSYNAGSVSGSDYFIGGLVGEVKQDANINSSYNTGTISGTAYYVGGLVGWVTSDANINASHNTGPVSGKFDIGGLVGYVRAEANIKFSYNIGSVAASSDRAGGLVGYLQISGNIIASYNSGPVSGPSVIGGMVGQAAADANINSSYNTGTVTGDANVGGLVGYVTANANITSSYNTGPVSGTTDVDGLVGDLGANMTTTSAYSSVASRYVATTPVADMKLASTFVGFDFTSANPVWGFGTCSDNGGYPMLRVFGGVTTFDSTGCYTAPQSETPAPGPTQAPTPNPVYSGPVISGAPSAVAGTEVTLTGNRLESMTTAHVGGIQVRIVSALSQSLTLDIPSSMVPGNYDLVLQSSFGTLTIQNGLTVLAPLDKVDEPATKKLTVGSFKGYIAIYTKGYEGQRLSAKVAGKWLVISELTESWKDKSYSRTVRFTGAGESIMVHLYIDREFVRTEELTTR